MSPQKANEDSKAQLVEELVGQFVNMGLSEDAARELARSEVSRGRDAEEQAEMPPFLVIPHARGWHVTRAHAVTDTEVFGNRAEAESRAFELAAGEGCAVVICDASGRPVKRVPPPPIG